MASKSKIIFFFVFLVLATDLVHGSAYDDCMTACKFAPSATVKWLCEQACLAFKIGMEPGSFIENKFETDHEHAGRVAVESPKLLTGLFNHGVAILEASPNSLIAQGHLDAHALFFVAQGKATADLILRDKRETLDLKVGDIIWIPSGTQVFMMNKDAVEKLVVIKLPQPVSTSEVKLLDPFTKPSHLLAEGISSVV